MQSKGRGGARPLPSFSPRVSTCIPTKAMLRMLTAVLPPNLTLYNLQTRTLCPVKLKYLELYNVVSACSLHRVVYWHTLYK